MNIIDLQPFCGKDHDRGGTEAEKAAEVVEPEPRNQCGETCERAKLCAIYERDEALLRQALEALERAHQTAMYQTIKARLPECGEFAGIAQDLDFVVAALRERLGDEK